MYAVIRTGGKQYRVAPEDVIRVEKLTGDVGETIQFNEVLMLGGSGDPEVGTPVVSGASVAGEVLEQGRDRKIIVFKKKRRKNYRRTKGHRQELTTVRITEILTDGKAPSKAKAKKAPETKSAKKEETKSEAKSSQKKSAEAKSDKPAEQKTEKAKAAKPAKGSEKARAFKPMDKPEGEPDDLQQITGVGPKLEDKLNNLGIWHYWQVAGFSADDITSIDDQLNFKGRIERDNWVGQAKDLMAGKTPRKKTK